MSFVSLFLGLVVGYQTVAVQVADPVALVSIQLDGEEVATLDGPPWQTQIDLGGQLRPHELMAIAFDSEGVELDRTQQWLNLPRQPAETTILLEIDPETQQPIANVTWKSLTGDEPSAVSVEFDGQFLHFESPKAIPLPPYDPELLHFLRVELEFAGLVSSTAEITFGGVYTDHVNTELTAFPVVLAGRKKPPKVAELQSGFLARGQPLQVAAIVKGQIELIVVRDQASWSALRAVRNQVLTDPGPPLSRRGQPAATGRHRWFSPDRSGWDAWLFRFLWPVPRRLDSGGGQHDLFSHSAKYAGSSGSLHGWLTTVEQPREWTGQQRLADAVAVAAVTVAGTNRRRAVLLVLAGESSDASTATPEAIRRYLDSLAVPLFVWTVDSGAPETPWGPAENVSNPTLMERATRELFRSLESQRIVWLEGIHLPQQITLAPSLEGVASIFDLSSPTAAGLPR